MSTPSAKPAQPVGRESLASVVEFLNAMVKDDARDLPCLHPDLAELDEFLDAFYGEA